MHESSPTANGKPMNATTPLLSPCHCAKLRRATRAVTRLYDERLAPSGLAVTQYSLLRALSRLEPATAGDLGAAMGLDRTTLVRNLKVLSDRDLVAASPDPADGRVRHLRLTEAGRLALAKAEPLWRTAQAELEDRLGRPGLDGLAAVLAGLQTFGG
ncbi:transcriptional regulator, MarR family [Solidesulfovibrio carbinoliphilus subsp. oakridgensis]|uniref:Transcriptional regulator, MarR family n=2 Tax=Solidesulfovibrio carbinoliphilus TaxID=345370 RepID=G7QCM6_9BACT|nr:transcriptional regulator, MarR family [Solidesulfovibrio carbinoliphilus subsp. oakridgensis]